MSCAEQRPGTQGFTLIEIIVAITILGMLTAVVSAGFRTGLQAWTRGNAAIDEIQSSQATLSLLRDQIQGALPLIFYRPQDPNSLPRLSFAGSQDQLRLVSRASFRDGGEAPPRWIELGWQRIGNSGRLTVKEFLILPPGNAPGSKPVWQGTVLEGGEFRFEYLARRALDEKASWVREWSESNLQMPAAVRMNLERRGHRYQIVLPLAYAENSWSGQWFR